MSRESRAVADSLPARRLVACGEAVARIACPASLRRVGGGRLRRGLFVAGEGPVTRSHARCLGPFGVLSSGVPASIAVAEVPCNC